jgi:hypothetical protein
MSAEAKLYPVSDSIAQWSKSQAIEEDIGRNRTFISGIPFEKNFAHFTYSCAS